MGCGCPRGAAWGRSCPFAVCLPALGKGISWKRNRKVSKCGLLGPGRLSLCLPLSWVGRGPSCRENLVVSPSRQAVRRSSYLSSQSGCQDPPPPDGHQLRVTSASPALPGPHLHQLETRRIRPVFPESPLLLCNRTEQWFRPDENKVLLDSSEGAVARGDCEPEAHFLFVTEYLSDVTDVTEIPVPGPVCISVESM